VTATSWTVVASGVRHRFGARNAFASDRGAVPARKRRRRFALPAHSKLAAGDPEKVARENAVALAEFIRLAGFSARLEIRLGEGVD